MAKTVSPVADMEKPPDFDVDVVDDPPPPLLPLPKNWIVFV